MEISIDQNSGFCNGVVNAIRIAEKELDHEQQLLCIGDIVHNTREINRLKNRGLSIITESDLQDYKEKKVLIRAHGEPPATYKNAEKNKVKLVDASCPVVLKLQHKIRKGFEAMKKVNGQILIFGKEGHAEVNGLKGQTDDHATIINDIRDIEKVDFRRPARLFSQTTRSPEAYREIISRIEQGYKKNDNSNPDFIAYNTVCKQVANREEEISAFALHNNIIIFVSDMKSSNGKFLFQVCKKVNERSYFVSDIHDIDFQWFNADDKVGICGATSTPMWLMKKVAEYIKNRFIK